jgi:hypothetical protein
MWEKSAKKNIYEKIHQNYIQEKKIRHEKIRHELQSASKFGAGRQEIA